MIHVGHIEAPFNINVKSMDVGFDTQSQQQFLTFNLALQVSIPQLLSQLMKYQFADALPRGCGEASSPGSLGVQALSLPQQQTPLQQAPLHPEDRLQRGTPGQQRTPSYPRWEGGGSRTSVPNEQALNMQLIKSVRNNNIGEAKIALQQNADVNCVDTAPHFRTPLHHALEAGGNVAAVHLLLEARANVNAATATGKTALHIAIQDYASIPPLVLRMLLTWKADHLKEDSRGTTPLCNAKMIAMQLSYAGDGGSSMGVESTRVRQLLHELSEQPTVAVAAVDCLEVKQVLFADMENDKLVFHTPTSVGLYSLKMKRIIGIKKLKMQMSSTVQRVSVNPALGTIAVCLSIADTRQEGQVVCMENWTIIWPNGHLQDEEPLKLTINIDVSSGMHEGALPTFVELSRGPGTQVLLSRLCDGQVYVWLLNAPRSQLVSEVKLMDRGGLAASSDDGCWMAVVNLEDGIGKQTEVWWYENHSSIHKPKHVATVSKKPVSMAIMQHRSADNQACCYLAVVEAALPGCTPPPVEVIEVQTSGMTSRVYRLKNFSPCYSLEFCSGDPMHILSGHTDASVLVTNLSTGEINMCHDNPGTGHISISMDRKLIASVEANYIRVFKVSEAEAP